MRKNKIFALVGPSGVGKDAVLKGVLEKLPRLRKSVSFTTRAPRPGEKNGQDYFFITLAEFKKLAETNEFLEYEQVHPGLYYGTSKKEITRLLEKFNVIKPIDILGSQSLKTAFPDQVFIIFIKPPNLDELKKRINKRGSHTREEIKKRLSRLAFEMSKANLADYRAVNDNLKTCVNQVAQVIKRQLNKK